MRKAIVIDANIMVRCILGKKVAKIMEEVEHIAHLLSPDVCFDDVKKYVPALAQKRGIPPRLIDDGLKNLEQIIDLVPPHYYEQRELEAKERLKNRDIHDWPILATALLFQCPVWTEDQDFFGTGIPTWTSNTVHLYFFD